MHQSGSGHPSHFTRFRLSASCSSGPLWDISAWVCFLQFHFLASPVACPCSDSTKIFVSVTHLLPNSLLFNNLIPKSFLGKSRFLKMLLTLQITHKHFINNSVILKSLSTFAAQCKEMILLTVYTCQRDRTSRQADRQTDKERQTERGRFITWNWFTMIRLAKQVSNL